MLHKLQDKLTSRIRYTIILPYMILAAALLVLLGALSFWIIANNLQDQLNQSLQTSATNTGARLEQIEATILDDLRLATIAPGDPSTGALSTADAFASNDQQQVQEIAKLALDFYKNDISRVIAIDASGTVIADAAKSEVEQHSPSLVGSGALATNPLVQAVLSGRVDKLGDKYTSLLQFGDQNPYTMLFVIAPVKQTQNGNETVVGALIFAQPLDLIVSTLNRQSGASITAVLNGRGEVLVSFPPEANEFQLTAQQLESLKSGGSLSTNIDRGDLAFQVLYNPLRIRRALDGFFAVGLPRSAISDAWQESQVAVALVALLALLSVLAMGARVTRQITRPLGELASTALEVKSGHLERRSDVARNDELGTLASVLNEMTDRLLELYRTSRQLGGELSISGVLEQTELALQRLLPQLSLSALVVQAGNWEAYTPNQQMPISPPFDSSTLGELPSVIDAQQLPDLAAPVRSMEPNAQLILPLRTQQQSIGVLVLAMPEPLADSQPLFEPLTAIASMAATAMNNALLYSTVQDEALRKQAILQSIADGVVVVDTERRVILTNSAAATMLNMTVSDLNSKTFAELPLEPLEAAPELFAQSPDLATPTLYQSGKRILSVSAAPIRTVEGREGGEVLVLHDVTAEREVDRAKTDFIATISHELRTPLTSICGYTDLLLRGFAGALEEEQREFLGTIRQQAQSMVDVLQNVIVIASIEAGTMKPDLQPYQVHSLVQQALATTQKSIEEKKLALNVEVPEDLPLVMVDRDHVKIVLTQLLDNARRYTDSGSVSIQAHQTNDGVQIDIRDTGRGISPEDQKRLFTRFQRGGEQGGLAVRERGAGLGLAIARQLVESQQGRIWVDSSVNEGSTFSVVFPLAPERFQHADEDYPAVATA